jgi:hypothetical protein
MEANSRVADGAAREEILASANGCANNCVWSYVSMLAWLRALRAAKILMLIFPAVFGGLASWYSLHLPQNTSVVAALAALAGFFPILFVALGLDERIAYYRTLAGRYRLIHALFQNISCTAARYETQTLEKEYDRAFADYCRVREEAHTVPRWCFVHAKKVIEKGEYGLTGNDLRPKGVKEFSSQATSAKPQDHAKEDPA